MTASNQNLSFVNQKQGQGQQQQRKNEASLDVSSGRIPIVKRDVNRIIAPGFMIVYGRPKTGKSTLMSMLPHEDTAILDFRNEYDQLEGSILKIKDMKDLENALAILKHGLYKRIVLDNATWLFDLLEPAIIKHFLEKTPMGKKYAGMTIRKVEDMPTEASYHYWFVQRTTIKDLIGELMSYCTTIILIAHMREASQLAEYFARKGGGAVTAAFSPNIPNKLCDELVGMADAVATFNYENGKNILDFNNNGGAIGQARCKHLAGEEIVIGKTKYMGSERSISQFWGKVFPDVKSDKE